MDQLRIVLVRPRNPENVGAVARAMRNFDLSDWAIVRLGTHDFAKARRVAVHAEDLLDTPRLCATLDEAVADCAWVVGTSARKVRGKQRLRPEEVGEEALARRPGRTAIVFGDERSGLTAAELDRCHDLSAVPTGAAQPSLNLAQAVLLYAWEACRAERRVADGTAPPGAAGDGGATPPRPAGAQATDAQLQAMEAALRDVLRAGGFLVGGERHAVRDLAGVLRRGRPSPRETRLWETALRSIGKRLPGRRAGALLPKVEGGMAGTFTWIDGGAERVFHLDPPGTPGRRYLAIRRAGGDEDWTAACVLAPGEAEREIGDQLTSAAFAEDVILKYAIQGLARLHGVSPAPGRPDEDAGEAEQIIARLWQALTDRWAPPR